MSDEKNIDLVRIRLEIESRIDLADADPESGHSQIDVLTEMVVRGVAAGEPDAVEAARLVRDLLDIEIAQNWARWYA